MRSLAWLLVLALGAAFGMCFLVRVHPPMWVPPAKEQPADNSFCYVCHLNFKNEELAQRHKQAGVGCMDCHGYSDDHSSDEDNVTPPEIMFPEEKIDSSCLKCHDPDRAGSPAGQDQAAMGTVNSQRHCTLCHGEHRMAIRTRLWDKATGKLIFDDGVRMTAKSLGQE